MFRRPVLLCFIYCSLSYPPVIAALLVLGGIFEDLGKDFVQFFLDQIGNLVVGSFQVFHRSPLPDLFFVLVEDLMSANVFSFLFDVSIIARVHAISSPGFPLF